MTTGILRLQALSDGGSGSGSVLDFGRSGSTFSYMNVGTITDPTIYADLVNKAVGLGTSTPIAMLQLADVTAPKLYITDTNASTDQKHWFMQSDTGVFSIGTTSDALVTNATYRPFAINAAGNVSFPYASTTALTVSGNAYFPGSGIWNSSGRVGIGTTTLDIAGTTLDTLVIGKASDVNAGIVLDLGAAGTGAYGFAIDGTINSRISYSAASKAMSFFANSLTAQMTLVSSGNVGIGITAPENTLQISTTSAGIVTNGLLLQNRSSTIGTGVSLNFISSGTSFSDNRYNSITSVNTDGSNGQALTFSTSNNAPQVERLRITSTGNVGIGTTTLNYPLTVAGSSAIASILDTATVATGIGGELYLSGRNTAGGQVPYASVKGFAFSGTPGAEAGYLQLKTMTAGTLTEKMRIDNNGNVGIGTTTPSGKLSVYSGASGGGANSVGDDLIVENNTSGGISILTPAANTGWLLFGSPTSNTRGAISYSHASDFMRLDTAGSERMRITSTGNVGIGTTTPGQKLSVAGDILGNNIIGSYFTGTSTTASTFAGNVGIGTTSPFAKLSVHAKATDTNTTLFAIASSTASATTTLFSVSNTGAVGIGTTTPGSIFSIQGVANFVASGVSTIYNSLRILGTLVLPSLATPAGSFLAVDASGNVIATTTPSGSGSLITHSFNTGTTYAQNSPISVVAGDVVSMWAFARADSGCSSADTIAYSLRYKLSTNAATTSATTAANAGTPGGCSVMMNWDFVATTTLTITPVVQDSASSVGPNFVSIKSMKTH
jgi:hypothetical protein